MLKLDPQEYAALARLVRIQEGVTLLRVLDKELEASITKLLDAPQDQVEAHRHRARTLRDVGRLLRDAPETAEKLKSQ